MAKVDPTLVTLLLNGEKDPSTLRFLSVRKALQPHLQSGKYPYRIEIQWRYEPDPKGLPNDTTAEAMEQLEGAITPALERNNLALLAYTLTGEGLREWCFYTRNLKAFGEVFNQATTSLPLYPLSFDAERDEAGEYFAEILSMAQQQIEEDDNE